MESRGRGLWRERAGSPASHIATHPRRAPAALEAGQPAQIRRGLNLCVKACHGNDWAVSPVVVSSAKSSQNGRQDGQQPRVPIAHNSSECWPRPRRNYRRPHSYYRPRSPESAAASPADAVATGAVRTQERGHHASGCRRAGGRGHDTRRQRGWSARARMRRRVTSRWFTDAATRAA